MRTASEVVIEIMNTGIGIQCIELVDAAFMRATVAAADPARKYHIADRLFFKLQGATPDALSESVVVVKKIVRKHGGDKFRPAKTQEEAEDGPEEWVVHRSGVCRRGSKDLNDRRMLVYEPQQDIEASGILFTVVGHTGDGAGEHEARIGKEELLVEELGEGTVGLMKTIKRAIDPVGIMNPGKLYPGPTMTLSPNLEGQSVVRLL